ncbi:uncharacterized protein LOC117180881 [Belonocnema kinseyi]|uniref:uncharacterized protein LOC117180881 n=1 Tax=Belonocnema kinseyi TaxID=2817044 RepID=UPI00143D9317|nr:uncharacterized protein LOC117180881 [Belonocnema kinseyi]
MKDIRLFLQGKPRNSVEQSLNVTLCEPLEGFPLQTVEQFENLNSKINIKLRKSSYNHLKLRGGTKLREFLSLALKMTTSEQLVAKFTWRGDKKHKKFGNTRVANVMFVAAKDYYSFSGP